MNIREAKIPGLLFIDMEEHHDDRGMFARNFCRESIESFGGYHEVAQANISLNRTKGTIRGFHFQKNGFEEAKTVTVYSGSLHYKVIDLRKDSPTYLEYESFTLRALTQVVQVPKGCAPGFQTLEEDTLLHYYVSTPYSKEHESGIRFDDPFFKMTWPLSVSAISDRDRGFPNFDPITFEALNG